ncbi:MAG TPA: TonB-dependent receptor [Terriglobales bacterium]|nr:TonB-dependent receptor [Terriglobales bacterium]
MKRRLQSLRGLSLLAVFTLVISQATLAQQVTANITGTVLDPTGAPIVGATVTASDTNRGAVYTAKSNESGIYSIQRVPIGTYAIKAESSGFESAQHSAVTLDLDQTARINFDLKVGSVKETVEVSSEAPVLHTDTTEVSTVIDAQTNDNLPLATRNPTQLTLLAPGSVTVDAASFNLGSNTAEGGGRPYINGNREQADNFLLDGVDNNQTSENRLGLTPAPDAIQEFNLITQNAPAEYGNFDGGIINTTLKSGTNAFHGDVWEFFRNDALNANKWENGLNPATPIGTPKVRWNMFGGTLGGPVLKNKLFFFADYQGGRLDHPPTSSCNGGGGTCSVLTTAERTGDFSALLSQGVQLFNPCAPGTGVSGTPCSLVAPAARVPFANNIIPSSMLDPAFTKLVTSSLYPSATPLSNGFGSAIDSFGQAFNSDQGDVKLDYNLSSKDRFNARYSQGKQNDPSSSSILLFGSVVNTANLYNTSTNWEHMISPSLVNEARFGTNYINFANNNYTFDKSVQTLAGGLGINGVTSAGLPLFGFGGGSVTNSACGALSCIGNNIALENFASTVVQFNDNVIYSHGRHVFKTGFQMNRYRINVFYAGNGGELGLLLYDGQYSGPIGSNVTATQQTDAAAADFALGLPSLVGRGVSGGGGGAWHQQDWLYAGFVQDDWRFTDHLTLNLGLRYEARTPWTEVNNRQVNVNIMTGALEYPGNATVVGSGSNGFSSGLYKSTYGLPDFQPRIGFAWTPSRSGNKMVVRGAYTISSYLEGTGTNLRLTQNPPNTPPQTQAVNVTSGTPFTTEAGPSAGAVIGGNPFLGATMLAWNPTVQPAMAQQYNLTIQQEVAKNTSLQVGYIGQHATHLMVPVWLTQNQLVNGNVVSTPYVGGMNPPGVNGSTVASPTYGPNGFGVVKDTASIGAMKYNALQAVLQKRESHGLETQISYTYSKCMTDNSGYFGTWSGTTQATPASPYFQNLYNERAEWAQCYWDSKHIVSAYAIYQLPVGHGKQFGKDLPAVVDAVVGNWSVNPIVSWHTGFPLALYGSDTTGTGSPGARPNCNDALLSYPKTTDTSGLLWFNPAFVTPTAPGQFGNCPAQGPVIGPGYIDADISLQKNFPIGEVRRFQFRADFLNAFNHPNFAHPNMSTGVINSTQDARQIQLALKFYF